jgi:transposase
MLRKRLRRGQVHGSFAGPKPCIVGMAACATAHFWARQLRQLGQDVRLMPAQYVKACLKRGKNDAADAAAICEAVTRPSMRLVPIKSEDQQATLMLHRARDLLVRQRTQLIDAIRGHLAEFGLIEAPGPWNVPRLLAGMEEVDLPDPVPGLVRLLANQLEEVEPRIREIDTQITAWHKASPVSQRLAAVPGIGPPVATAIAATMPDPAVFRSGREFAARLGLVPRQNPSGGKTRLGRTSRQGNAYIRRRLLVIGAQSALFCSKATKANPRVQTLLAKRPRLVVAVALANKMARIAWALMVRPTTYQPAAAAQVRAATRSLRGEEGDGVVGCTGGLGQAWRREGSRARGFVEVPIRGTHPGLRSVPAAHEAGHMTASNPPLQTLSITLAGRGPSTHGASRRPRARPRAPAGRGRGRRCRAAWRRTPGPWTA